MNIKMIKGFEYLFIQLLLKYQSKYFVKNNLYENILYFKTLKIKFKRFLKKKSIINDRRSILNAIISIKKCNFEKRLVRLNNVRNLTFDKRIKMKENIMQKMTKNRKSLKLNDLIKLY